MQPKRQRMELTREQHAPSNTEGDERFNSGAGASGNNYGYAQQVSAPFFSVPSRSPRAARRKKISSLHFFFAYPFQINADHCAPA